VRLITSEAIISEAIISEAITSEAIISEANPHDIMARAQVYIHKKTPCITYITYITYRSS